MPITKVDLDKADDLTRTLLKKLGVKIDYKVSADLEGLKIDLTGKDAAMLIGYHGENLRAFSYMLKMLIRQEIEKDTKIKIDIDGYLIKREKNVEAMIRRAIAKVKESGEGEEIQGLSAYERRIAHTMVADEGLVSESLGEGKKRILNIRNK
jgi:predicted RNA-binding protein Jag